MGASFGMSAQQLRKRIIWTLSSLCCSGSHAPGFDPSRIGRTVERRF
ncbi:hypothetical protein [Allobaculum sp. Allo2]|nr:hypothetical protein [Allobaculum sp. Allo2]UNT93214.1 hypothetical protein KWG61_14680 [Allobaculum sp. Allo2]